MATARTPRIRAVSQTHETPAKQAARSTAEPRHLCLTCHQPLPDGQDHPPVIGYMGPPNNMTTDLIDTIDPLFHFLDTIHRAIFQLMENDPLADEPEEIIRGLAWLAEHLGGELHRRTDWLHTLSIQHLARKEA